MISKMKYFVKLPFYEKLKYLSLFYHWLKTILWYRLFFKNIGKKSIIIKPLKITPKYIYIEENVKILNNARIEGVSSYINNHYNPEIYISSNVSIQQNLHLTCANKISIGKNTAIAANVTITDINHPYKDINIPVEKQPLEIKEVSIGADSKIYNNCVILPGVSIGKHCVIGANSVVTQDIPDYSVAVGAPAKVIKKYNFKTKKWETI